MSDMKRTYCVQLRKSYLDRDGDRCATIKGYIEVEAEGCTEADEIVDKMLEGSFGYYHELADDSDEGRPLQTLDPRIHWDSDPPENGIYEDWTFERTGFVAEKEVFLLATGKERP
jgi:hypothetical protein